MTTKQFHWCVKQHKIDDLERALNMYDQLGWRIFDVDISMGGVVVVMCADRSNGQKRPPERPTKAIPNGLKELPGKPLSTPPAIASLPTGTVGLSIPDVISD